MQWANCYLPLSSQVLSQDQSSCVSSKTMNTSIKLDYGALKTIIQMLVCTHIIIIIEELDGSCMFYVCMQ